MAGSVSTSVVMATMAAVTVISLNGLLLIKYCCFLKVFSDQDVAGG